MRHGVPRVRHHRRLTFLLGSLMACLQGTLAGPLQGAGLRWSEAELRQRLINPRVLNPESLMPAFHDTGHQHQVARAYAGKPILSASQIEDVVAYLLTLREAP